MVLTYNGISALLTELNASEVSLRKAVLDPYSNIEVWSHAKDLLGDHDYHELQLMHDTLYMTTKGKYHYKQ